MICMHGWYWYPTETRDFAPTCDREHHEENKKCAQPLEGTNNFPRATGSLCDAGATAISLLVVESTRMN